MFVPLIFKDAPTENMLTAITSLSWRTPTLFLLPLSFVPSLVYNLETPLRKSIWITDILGLSFSHNALSLLTIDSFKTGSILLSGLFVYDIWWVFGTEVVRCLYHLSLQIAQYSQK